MLPLLPALLLLLLQGPSNAERLGPAACAPRLAAILRLQELGALPANDVRTLASLLVEWEDGDRVRSAEAVPAADTPAPESPRPRLADGHARSVRSRDGPR